MVVEDWFIETRIASFDQIIGFLKSEKMVFKN
jgi:hypothetical protein